MVLCLLFAVYLSLTFLFVLLFSGFPSLCCISTWFFYTYPGQKGVFVWYLPWKPARVPGGKSHNLMEAPGWVGLPGVFNSLSCLHWPSAMHQLRFWLSYPGIIFCSGFHLRIFCSYQPTDQVIGLSGGSGLPRVLSCLTDPGRVVDFSVCSDFSWLGWVMISKRLACGTRNQQISFLKIQIIPFSR